MRRLSCLTILTAAATTAAATTAAATTASAQITLLPASGVPRAGGPSNSTVARIFDADQADRRGAINWTVVGPADAQRRAAVRKLMAQGELRTGEDFRKAAFVFQHSSSADDCLLAHVLATIAAARGDKEAPWIAAATLDRYLQAIGRKQIFGTQYMDGKGADPETTQEPYDRGLLSDALRAHMRVISQAEQEKKRAELSRPEEGAAP